MNNDKIWFAAKHDGHNASPVNWKGWAWIVAYAAALAWLAWTMVVQPTQLGLGPSEHGWLVWAALTGALTVAFIALRQSRTEGHWRWQWLNGDERQGQKK